MDVPRKEVSNFRLFDGLGEEVDLQVRSSCMSLTRQPGLVMGIHPLSSASALKALQLQ